jgi:DNA polymerase I
MTAKAAPTRVYLVDAHAFIHRAYHALPPLANSKGEPVGALFGFARMLLQLMKKEKPDRIVVCFDRPEPTFRHKAYDQYKATRKEIDQDLIAQLNLSREMAEAMGFCCADAAGYEADDVMATLARRAAKDGDEAILVTGDKDALQMIGPGIRVLNVAKGVWMDAPQVEEKFGVPPSAVVDYLSIIGDSSDNVPGVRGIGPVGAVKLLKQFGTLDKAVKAARAGDPAIPAKTAAALVSAAETARQAQDLVKLHENVPLDFKLCSGAIPAPEPEKLKTVFSRLEFYSLLNEILPGSAPAPAAAETKAEAREESLKDLKAALLKAKELVVAALPNLEADLAEPSRGFVALGLPDGRFALVTQRELLEDEAALKLLSGPALKSVYDYYETQAALGAMDLRLAEPYFDTKLAAFLVNPGGPREKGYAGPAKDWKPVLLARAARALGHKELVARMKERGVLKLHDELELPLLGVLDAMETEGIALDVAYLKKLGGEFETSIDALKKEIETLAGAPINLNSSKQLGELLYDKLGLPVSHKTASGGRSTDEEALKSLAGLNPIPAKVLEYREYAKLKSTYIDGLLERVDPKTGRVHTHFDPTGAATGRLSSVDPNLQNIPIRSAHGQKIRRAFVARPGYVLLSADYSQIDLRVLAHVSGDKALRQAFEDGGDIHTRTASEVFKVAPEAVDKELRRSAKAINFGIVYGQTPHGLSEQLGIPYGKAADYIKQYFERYSGVAAWIKSNLEAARKDGFVRTFSGRVRVIPELSAKNTALRQFGERAAGNTPIQGGSADVIKYAMLELRDLKTSAKMLLQIHDELVFEVPKKDLKAEAEKIKKIMEGAVKLDVPLVVDVKAGPNWQDMEPLK